MRNVQGTYQLGSQNLTPPSFYTETLESVHTHVHTGTHTYTHVHTHTHTHTHTLHPAYWSRLINHH